MYPLRQSWDPCRHRGASLSSQYEFQSLSFHIIGEDCRTVLVSFRYVASEEILLIAKLHDDVVEAENNIQRWLRVRSGLTIVGTVQGSRAANISGYPEQRKSAKLPCYRQYGNNE